MDQDAGSRQNPTTMVPWSWTAVLQNREISSRHTEATPRDARGQACGGAEQGWLGLPGTTGPGSGVLRRPTLLAAKKEILHISTQEG